jgi:hypothetical protein
VLSYKKLAAFTGTTIWTGEQEEIPEEGEEQAYLLFTKRRNNMYSLEKYSVSMQV